MTSNPIKNAILALGYITVVSLVMSSMEGRPEPRGLIGPIAFLSLFTLSAAVMGYLFLSEPLRMYFDGEKSGAVKLFLRTLLAFAVLTVALFLSLLLFS